jgi:exosome complex component RRP40
MTTKAFVLPGDHLNPDLLPNRPDVPLKLGPGLRHIPPNTISPTVSGQLCTDARKNAIWIEHNSGRVGPPSPFLLRSQLTNHNQYIPTVGDLVIATIHHSSGDIYYASITDHTAHAILPILSFEGATKKTRPQLSQGALVYARVTLANKHMDPELECVSSSTGKSEGLGPLVGGMVFGVSLGMARRLMMAKPAEQGGLTVLEELGQQGVAFEIAVGRNGRVWVDGKGVKAVLAVGRALVETDGRGLGVEEQRMLVRALVKEL